MTSHIDARARRWVREVRVFGTIASTNDVLKDAARQGAGEGAIAIAQGQTAGRGRHGRSWVSPPGNLFLSLLLRPDDASLLSWLPLTAGVAVADAVEVQGVACRLKWPNDVLASGAKLAGILAEAGSDAGRVSSVVIGIGVNVDLKKEDAPAEIRETITSLCEETGRAHDRAAVAGAVLSRWVLWYDALRGDRRRVRDAWRERAVDWWGRPVEVLSGGQRVVGVARDIDDGGGLILETADGARVTVVSGEARALRPLRN